MFKKCESYWASFELHLFPYAKQVKGLGILEDVIKKTHKVNIDNVMHLLMCYFKNE